ncbi:universal stress protein [Tenacibaculum sp. UWU-22]|uniref:universal stress protein n=1 Tax=Tenacibaculum sp. UWU-22 TaxID=3234187 RepID=UPI0034DAC6EC
MKKILVPVDFSTPSEYAAKTAAKIAKKLNSEVHLLHMIELPKGIIDMGAGSNFSIPESMIYVQKVRDKLLDFKQEFFSEKTVVKHAIRFQRPYQGILDYGKKIKVDLIVMGSRGHSEFEEMLIGSNTEKVVRSSKTPVLVVKREDKFKTKNFVFASSFKSNKKAAFEKFLVFANFFDVKIHLLKVNTPHKFENTHSSIEKIKEFIKDYDLPKYTIDVYNDSSVERGILNFSKDVDADLIALRTHGRSGLSHIFNGSITKHVSKKAQKPMLTINV